MSAERCACGRFLTLPGGMAQIEDGVYHVPAGAPACEVIALRAEVERLTKELDDAVRDTRKVALTAAGYVGALLAGGPDVVTVSAQRLVEARLPRVEARPGGGVRFTLTDATLGEELDKLEHPR